MNTEIMFFVGGILMSGLLGLVFWVSSNKKEIVKIQEEDTELLELLNNLKDEVKNLEIQVYKFVDDIYRDTDQRFQNEERSLDSRLDKMENRLHTMYEDGCKPVDKLKTQLNG